MALIKSVMYDKYIKDGCSKNWALKKVEIDDIDYNIDITGDLIDQFTKMDKPYNQTSEEINDLQMRINYLQDRKETLIRELKEIEEKENGN